MANTKLNIRKRMILLYGFFVFITILFLGRTAYVQIIKGPQYKKEAEQQQTRDSMVSPKRGTIFDRNNKVLAQSASASIVCVVPVEIREAGNAEEIAAKLSEILGVDYDTVIKKINKNSYYEIVKKKVEKAEADKIRELGLKGVRLDEDTKRYYPNGNLAAHVIGFTGDDNQGLAGIELVLDKELKGVSGRIKTAKSANGVDMPYEYEQYMDPVAGSDVVLTIDEVIQHFVEKHLENARIDNLVADGAAAIVMNPKTGEILAMTTKPDFDLNNPMALNNEDIKNSLKSLSGDGYLKTLSDELNKMWRNKAVVDTYEPGSTFKIAVAAMALDENVVGLNDTFFCKGHKTVSGVNIRCHKNGGHGSQTFIQGVQNSCNPVFIEVGERVGAKNFIKYYKAFGFAEKTGFELPGEAVGGFHTEEALKPLELATCSFGQSFNVTALQMITAVSSIANGGNLMKPYVIKQINNEDGSVAKVYEPEVIRQVISKSTSDTLSSILEGVVSEGGGKNAYVKGYRVAGKTGTSEKLPRGSGEYIASFVGFAPADDPQIACIVLLDNPRGINYYGGVIAAPVVANIINDSLRYLGVEPQYKPGEEENDGVAMPDIRGLTVEEAKAKLLSSELKYQIEGDGDKVVNQSPSAGIRLLKGAVGIMYTKEGQENKQAVVPNITGLTVLESNKSLANSGLNFKISGPGRTDIQTQAVAVRQEPVAGTELPIGSVVYVEFRYVGEVE